MCCTLCRSFENASLWLVTLVCAYSTAILTDRGPSKLVAECIFYALQVRTWTTAKFFILGKVMKNFCENSLPVLTYTVNIWHVLEVDENIITQIFLTQKFCKQS